MLSILLASTEVCRDGILNCNFKYYLLTQSCLLAETIGQSTLFVWVEVACMRYLCQVLYPLISVNWVKIQKRYRSKRPSKERALKRDHLQSSLAGESRTCTHGHCWPLIKLRAGERVVLFFIPSNKSVRIYFYIYNTCVKYFLSGFSLPFVHFIWDLEAILLKLYMLMD